MSKLNQAGLNWNTGARFSKKILWRTYEKIMEKSDSQKT